ncbi:MAG TPA: hypothetical protein VLH56_14450 [Dissulfurispiraceae bacterium]|nr:hypothetical protein [Dissulfurispiraceae bacterium]
MKRFKNILYVNEPTADQKSTIARAVLLAEGVTNYVEREQARYRNELYRLAEELRGWIGKEAYDYLAPGFHLPKGPAKKVIAPLAAELRADLVSAIAAG